MHRTLGRSPHNNISKALVLFNSSVAAYIILDPGTNVVVDLILGTCCCYQIFNVLKRKKLFLISQPIVKKLRLQIGDNIHDFAPCLICQLSSKITKIAK